MPSRIEFDGRSARRMKTLGEGKAAEGVEVVLPDHSVDLLVDVAPLPPLEQAPRFVATSASLPPSLVRYLIVPHRQSLITSPPRLHARVAS